MKTLLHTLASQPFHVFPTAWDVFLLDVMSKPTLPEVSANFEMEPRPKVDCMGDAIEQMTWDGSIAIIPINGMLTGNASGSDKYLYGVSSYGDILADINAAKDRASGIILKFGTCPGGAVVGGDELASEIVELSESGFEINAFTQGQKTSMGEYLGAGCSNVFVTPSSINGSIGTMAIIPDASAMFAAMGLKFNVFTSGIYKGTGNPEEPMSLDQKLFVQSFVDDRAAEFKNHMRAFRPQVSDEAMEGQWFTGAEAVEEGLADDVVSGLGEVLELMR